MIKIYGSDNCVWCAKAKDLCENFYLDYEYLNIGPNEEFPDGRVFTGGKIPQIFWDNRYVGGYVDLEREIENTNIGNYGQGKL